MNWYLPLLAVSLATSVPPPAKAPHTDISIDIRRASENELTPEQTAILNEVSKLSAACRIFHGLYDRWPADLDEIRGRTEGIDFGVLQGRTRLDLAPEGLVITFFDSRDERSMLATSEVPASDALRESARDPRFRIRVTLRDVGGF